jgi:hypothetical protein
MRREEIVNPLGCAVVHGTVSSLRRAPMAA